MQDMPVPCFPSYFARRCKPTRNTILSDALLGHYLVRQLPHPNDSIATMHLQALLTTQDPQA